MQHKNLWENSHALPAAGVYPVVVNECFNMNTNTCISKINKNLPLQRRRNLSAFYFGFFFVWLAGFCCGFFFSPGQWLPPDSQHTNRYLVNQWPNSHSDSTFSVAPLGVVYCVLSGASLVSWSPQEESQASLSCLPWKPNWARACSSLHPGYSQHSVPQLGWMEHSSCLSFSLMMLI